MSNDLPTNHFIKESISFAFTIVLVNIKDTRYTGFYDKLTGNCNCTCSLSNSKSCRIGMAFFAILADLHTIGPK